MMQILSDDILEGLYKLRIRESEKLLVERVYEQRPHDMSTTTYTTQPQGLALCSRCRPAWASEAPL